MTQNFTALIDYDGAAPEALAQALRKAVASADLPAANIKIARRPEDIESAERLIVPGHGAFSDVMKALAATPDMIKTLKSAILKKGKPCLGIGTGMQIMASRGVEKGAHAGLNLIEGDVVPLKPDDRNLAIPHKASQEILIPSPGLQDNHHFVLRSAKPGAHYSFLHSFVFQCKYDHHILAMVDYGGLQTAAVGRDNIIGLQFHPEESRDAGLQILKDFLLWRP